MENLRRLINEVLEMPTDIDSIKNFARLADEELTKYERETSITKEDFLEETANIGDVPIVVEVIEDGIMDSEFDKFIQTTGTIYKVESINVEDGRIVISIDQTDKQ